MHHPFTSPHDEDLGKLDTDPGHVRAKAYDLVLNGSEIGGGSIRIHDSTMQSRIFSLLNISPEEAKLRFGFFLEALEYGTPPHGGIALGLDRMTAILSNESSIREVIAFPKTARWMSDAPSPVDAKQLRDLISSSVSALNRTPDEENLPSRRRHRDAVRRARREPETHRSAAERPDSDAWWRDHDRGRSEGRAAGAADFQAAA
jgi:hypothetical protein